MSDPFQYLAELQQPLSAGDMSEPCGEPECWHLFHCDRCGRPMPGLTVTGECEKCGEDEQKV